MSNLQISSLLLLKQQQQANGSFLDNNHKPSLLMTALVLDALTVVPSQPLLTDIKDKAVNFLLKAKNAEWIFPASLGITCIIFSALFKYKRDLVPGRALARMLVTLTDHEVAEGGPYFYDVLEGVSPVNPNRIVDVGTNVAIANYLRQYNVQLPKLNAFIEHCRIENNFTSQEFCPLLVVWLMAKIGANTKVDLPVAEAVQPLPPVVTMAWKLEDEAVTASASDNTRKSEVASAEEEMLLQIKQQARACFSNLDSELQQLALVQIEKSIAGNSNKQMSLMPWYMREALGEKGVIFSDSYIARLGLVNILFWTAFIIYDDFWDKDEAALPHLLSVANIYAREFITFFNKILAPASGLSDFFYSLMSRLDAANAWETLHCRATVIGSRFFVPVRLPEFENFEKKYEPASAHILGSVALFYQLGFPINSWETQTLINYFRNYLIPMQINDDLHDWQEDLRRGHLSTVVTMLLEDLGSDWREIDLVADLPELEQVFWSKTLPRAGALAHSYLDKARTALYGLYMIENRLPLEKFIISIERSIDVALNERALAVDFLQYFKTSTL